jgi:MinD-like ATPase involved in chromosome partitioning or flagellar assembly
VIPAVPEGPVVPDRSAVPSGPVIPPAATGKPDKPTTEKPGRQPPAKRGNSIAAALPGAGTAERQTPASVPGTVTPPAGIKAPLSAPTIERALSGKSRDRNLSWRGTVKVVTGKTQGPGARDQEALDRARARLPLKQAKRVLMLGCTSGAGQTVTTLMTGHILASLREHPVAAVDLNDGTLTRYGAPAAWLEEVLGGQPPQRNSSPRPDGLNPNAKGGHAQLDVIASREPLKEGDEIKLAVQFGRHYPLTMLDSGAHGLTRLLKVADQLVIVVPASVEAAGALADTREWLDAHGFGELVAHSVTLINGVSRPSLADVEAAESVARGRCRAIVRVPWDEMLPVGGAGPSTLRPQTRVAYTALAGVLVAGMAAAPVRIKK